MKNAPRVPDRLRNKILRVIRERMTLDAEWFFLEQRIDYRSIPKKKWPAIHASIRWGQPAEQAISKPAFDPVALWAEKVGDDFACIFDECARITSEHQLARIALISRFGDEAKRVPQCLATLVVKTLDDGLDLDEAIKLAMPGKFSNPSGGPVEFGDFFVSKMGPN